MVKLILIFLSTPEISAKRTVQLFVAFRFFLKIGQNKVGEGKIF